MNRLLLALDHFEILAGPWGPVEEAAMFSVYSLEMVDVVASIYCFN